MVSFAETLNSPLSICITPALSFDSTFLTTAKETWRECNQYSSNLIRHFIVDFFAKYFR